MKARIMWWRHNPLEVTKIRLQPPKILLVGKLTLNRSKDTDQRVQTSQKRKALTRLRLRNLPILGRTES